MNLSELSTVLNTIKISHSYNELKEQNKLYLEHNKFTIILNQNENKSIILKVWKKWNNENPIKKQTEKDIQDCKLIKYIVLKKLIKINIEHCNNELLLEELPEGPQDTVFNKQIKSILDY